MAFPDDELGTKVELKLGTTWTDITPDVKLGQLITITRGRADGASQVGPSKTALAIKNPDGKYSPRNPVGPYYGLIGRNTQLRVSVAPTTATWLDMPAAGQRASTPDNALLDITGDIDIRVDLAMDDWLRGLNVELLSKWAITGSQRSWRLTQLANGTIELQVSPDGTNASLATLPSTVAPSTAQGQRLALRVTLDVDNGASGRTATFYTAPTTAGPWTQLGAQVVQAGTTSIFNSTAPLEVGDTADLGLTAPIGRYFAAEIRNGIAGTVVANPDFTAQSVGATSFTDTAGRTWTITGATITNRDVRVVDEVPAWPVRWAPTDQAPAVSLEAAGILRRLGQGSSPLDSTLRRRIPSDPHLIAYWPMEEAQGATQAYSPIAGIAPMAVKGLTFGADDTLPGSKALPTLASGGYFSAGLPANPATGGWHVEHVYLLATAPVSYAPVLTIASTGTVRTWQIFLQSGDVKIQGADANGSLIVDQAFAIGSDLFGSWTRERFTLSESGGTVTWTASWNPVGGVGGAPTGTYSGTAGSVSRVYNSTTVAIDGIRMGHVAVFNTTSITIFDSADTGFAGETVVTRLQRLSQEESVPLVISHTSDSDVTMGAQRSNTLLGLLQECADADSGGILYETRDDLSLAFRSRGTLYNQAPALALSYSNGLHEVAPPLEPEDDDQATVNDVTVTRASGSSGHQTLDEGPLSTQDPPDGVGRYPTSISLNLNDDDQPDQHAAWRLHVGTYDGVRYPAVTVNLARAPHLIAAASGVDIGDRITISDPPVWLPPDTIDLLVQGITETVGIRTWRITYLCVPAGPWTVGILEDAILGRPDTNASQLAAAVSATDTMLPVLVTEGAPWVTSAAYPAEFPFDVRLGGEVVTVTGIGGSATDGFSRTVTTGWGTSETGQVWTTSGGSSSDFSVQGV